VVKHKKRNPFSYPASDQQIVRMPISSLPQSQTMTSGRLPAACEMVYSEQGQAPVLFASPHSGRHYPDDFLSCICVPEIDLRRTEDAFIDELFSASVLQGAVLLKANYPRSYVDLNRSANELDHDMFSDGLPRPAGRPTAHVLAGLGCLPRISAAGAQIYAGKLRRAEGEARLTEIHDVYHHQLRSELKRMQNRSGHAILIDCHSMPSTQPGRKALPDIVLGDRFGSSCSPRLTHRVERSLRQSGLSLSRNAPYAGGYTTRTYGQPKYGVHALQIELNRRLYMDEETVEKSPDFPELKAILDQLISDIISCATDF